MSTLRHLHSIHKGAVGRIVKQHVSAVSLYDFGVVTRNAFIGYPKVVSYLSSYGVHSSEKGKYLSLLRTTLHSQYRRGVFHISQSS